MEENFVFQGLAIMFSWDKKSIQWFELSAKSTTFHKEIAKKIIPYLDKSSTLLSLGSGMGFLERELSNFVKQMILVDNSSYAVEYLEKNKENNQFILNTDWKNINIKSDYLLLSFFSRMYVEDTFESFLELTNKKIFYLINERRCDIEEVINYLDSKNASYSYEKMNLDFDQILYKTEINAYLEKYYKDFLKIKKEKLLTNFKKIDDKRVVFKNKKKIVLFIINKE
ncbi:MAG: hypothetical protein PQJ45_11220 [Sphaerochaetaceae bacterium]|nr:hypothetical protein [Sphaerochaetaceae bacterium]